jgi:hypothetical protein
LEVELVVRQDRRLFVVGKALADVYLLRPSGSVEKHFFLPWSLKGFGEDQEYLNRELEHLREEVAKRSVENPHLRQALHDATKLPRQPKVQAYFSNPLIAGAFAKDRDLVLTTYAGGKPANALLWLSDNGQSSRCFLLGDLLEKRAAADPGEAASSSPRVAVTSDRLWLLSPPGYFLWEELESFWEEAQKKEKERQP